MKTNNSLTSQTGSAPVPAYQKWYSSPKMVHAARGRAMVLNEEPEPESEPWHVVWNKSFSDSYYKGKPSTSGDHMETAEKSFTVPSAPTPQPTEEDPTPTPPEPLEATCNMTLTVDDWGKMSVGQSSTVAQEIDMTSGGEGPQGGHAKWTKESGEFTLKSGEYTLHVEQSNIDYDPPENNISVCDYEFEAHIDKEGPPEDGGEDTPDCGCDDSEDDGGSPPSPSYARSSRLQTIPTLFPFTTSSAGGDVQAVSNASRMYWQTGFGRFRGMSGIPRGKISLQALEGIDGLEQPSSLHYDEPLASYIDIPEGGIVPGSKFDVVSGAKRTCFQCEVDGTTLTLVGVFTASGSRAFLVTIDDVKCIKWVKTDKSVAIYDTNTGELVSYTTKWGATYTKAQISSYLQIKKDNSGALRQIWNLWDGLLNIESSTATGYTIAFYTSSQVTGQDSDGFFTVEGDPFKKFVVNKDTETNRLSITEQTKGRQDFTTAWWNADHAWNMMQGTGAEAIVTTRERTDLEPDTWQLITTVSQGINGDAVSKVYEIYQTTAYGDLLLTQIEGYGSSQPWTITCEYDYFGRKTKETHPNGAVWEWKYDMLGRVILERKPWCGGQREETTYEYVTDDGASELSNEIAVERRIMRGNDNNPIELWKKIYTYSEINHVKRVEIRMTALEMETVHFSVQETWLASAPNPHARGRIKMTQGANGVQTCYEYMATNDHGALYSITRETRINGEAVPGRSTRDVTFITPEGNTVREESYILLSNSTWALTDSADYEFDMRNHWTKRTRGNGRVTERELICDGRILWEKDEDGVQINYAYDSARQLIEKTRSATATTPETIITYTRDALGRETSVRTDTGAMSTIIQTGYDLLGRIISETDALGRVTTHSYTADGLTETITTPMGGTLITQRHADGTVLRQYGTGQQDLKYQTDMAKDGIRVTTTVLNGTTRDIRTRIIKDGFGQKIRDVAAHTMDDGNYHYLTYDEKGHLLKNQWETLAPTLYEYDSFGKTVKEIIALADEPTIYNSKITEYSYSVEQKQDGIYEIVTTTTYTAEGTPIARKKATLISALSPTLESKVISTDARDLDTVEWTEYAGASIRDQKKTLPGVDTASVMHIVDGFMVSQTDHAGTVTSQTRSYAVTGVTHVSTDGRRNSTTTVYDTLDRIVSITDANGDNTAYSYEQPIDKPTCIANALGKTNCYAYDVRGRKIAEWGTALQPAVFAYNDADQIVSLTTFRVSPEDITTDPRERTDGDTTAWSYHAATGLETRKTYPDGTHVDTAYNVFNKVSSSTNGRGNIIERTYDSLTGVLIGFSFNEENMTDISASYNHLGQLISVTDASGTRSFIYNQYGELQEESTAGLVESRLISSRDNYGRKSGYILEYGESTVQQTNWGYDSSNRLSSVSLNAIVDPFTYGYEAGSGLQDTLSYPNSMQRRYTWEEHRNLLAKITYWRRNSANDPARIEYTYDALGSPMTKKEYFNAPNPDLIHEYGYNDRGELVTDTMSRGGTYSYTYDNIGNREVSAEQERVRSYVSNQLNQHSSISDDKGTTISMIYDADGNQTAIMTSTGEWMVTYNALNQAVAFTQGSKRIECVYDYLNRRVEKAVYEDGNLISKKRFIYQNYLQIAELDATNITETVAPILRKTYLWDPLEEKNTRILAMTTFDETGSYQEDLYYMHDALKNTIAMFGVQAGRRALYEYGPYGTILKMEGNAAEINPFRFSSEYHDEELGLVAYIYRYYHPLDGRWLTRDPIGEKSLYNLYAFVKNMPSFDIDYLGKEPGMGALCTGTQLPPSTYRTSNPCWTCPKESRYRLVPGKLDCCEYRTNKPKPGYTPPVNGCGSDGGLSFPDKFPLGVDFTSACNAHDTCYGTCGNKKSECDKTFLADMKAACHDAMTGYGRDLGMLAECNFFARSYYNAVNLLGFGAYQDAQNKGCEWERCKP